MVTRSTLGLLFAASILLGCESTTSRGPGGSPTFDVEGYEYGRVTRLVDPVIVPPPDVLVDECRARRVALAEGLGGPALVFVRAAPGDDENRFFQADDFWYLAGVDIPDIALALVVGQDGELLDEVLFLPEHDPVYQVWSGDRLAPGPEAEAATGFARTAPLPAAAEGDESDPWTSVLTELWRGGPLEMLSVDDAAAPEGMLVEAGRGSPLRKTLDALRLVKSDYELHCMRNAIDITCAAQLCAMAEVAPGLHEYTAQAAIDGTFLRLGSERPGFPSICGAGHDSVVLHYESNRGELRDGDLMVMDVGAKYRGYCADVTRTIPVSGRFTPRQREIYDLVLAAQTAAAAAARPGMTLRDVHAVAYGVLEQAGYAQYFPHGTSHWLGLDVHDVGPRGAPLAPGTLFTIEPGIYIPDESLGVRIEDDYLMTEEGAVKLSTGVPSDPDALEALMAGLH
ncbi:MAG: aminopeptidase P N-terminal domain-containing protein [Planctomycetes bacterium]|nr:aminopeptidase P N-terminal domain-containing protein [Planctomycetota bacterium]